MDQTYVLHEASVGYASALSMVQSMEQRLSHAGWDVAVWGGEMARPVAESDTTRAGVAIWVPAGDPEEDGQWVTLFATASPGGDHLDVHAPGVFGAGVWPILEEAGIGHHVGRLSIEVHDDAGPLEDIEAIVAGCPAGVAVAAASAMGLTPGDTPVKARVGSSRVEVRRAGELVDVDLGELSTVVLDHMDDAAVAAALDGYGESPAIAVARNAEQEVTDRELLAGF
ncbi:MAG: hypothetical protein KDB24_18015, partial [Microthrixaceae bacterium]|nr:hypothetical protein [Microthrixaceae bacterium]